MDFRTCPSCQQSVLDDDVQDCPFCGSSMTAKPGQRPQPAAPAQAADKTSPAAAQQESAKTSASKPSQPENDDPFAVEDAAARKAIPLAVKPAKGRMFRVVCPMCETQGFTSKKAAGKEVKCANPQCLVPIFTAPELEKKETPAEKPEKGLSVGMLGGITAAVLLLIGVGVWQFVLKSPTGPDDLDTPTGVPTDPTSTNGETDNGQTIAEGDPQKAATKDGQQAAAAPKPPTLAEIRRQSLEGLAKSSLVSDRNRSKPLCRQLAAEACASINDLQSARSHLDSLKQVGRAVPFHQVLPFSLVAWQELKAGRTAEAKQALDEALKQAERLPPNDRGSMDAATSLAAVLVAMQRTPEAVALVNKFQDDGPQGRLSALTSLAKAKGAAKAPGGYNLDQEIAAAPAVNWSSPQWTAVTAVLGWYGYWDEALAWAEKAPSVESRTEAVTAWAETLARQAVHRGEAKLLDRLPVAAEKLNDLGRARLYARVAAVQLQAEDGGAAEESLAAAKESLDKAPAAKPVKLPGLRGIYDWQRSNTAPARMAALAGAEIARVEAKLRGPQAGWTILQQALEQTRSIGPALPAVRERQAQLQGGGDIAVRNELKSLLSIERDDDARLRLNQYRRHLDELTAQAEARFQLQVTLLASAADWGPTGLIWEDIQSRSRESDPELREPYLNTSLPAILAVVARKTGDTELADAIAGRQETEVENSDLPRLNAWKTLTAAEGGDIRAAAKTVEQATADPAGRPWRAPMVMHAASRLVSQDRIAEALEFITLIDGARDYLREEALALVTAQAARENHAAAVWAFLNQRELSPTERVAVYHGLLTGLGPAAPRGQETAGR